MEPVGCAVSRPDVTLVCYKFRDAVARCVRPGAAVVDVLAKKYLLRSHDPLASVCAPRIRAFLNSETAERLVARLAIPTQLSEAP
jgi:hypothetical protein